MLRIALVGVNGLSPARRQSLCRLRDVEVVGIQGFDETLADGLDEPALPGLIVNSFSDVLAADFDGIAIGSTSHSFGALFPLIVQALEHDRHVVVDSLVSLSAAELDRLDQARRQSRGSLMFQPPRRFDPRVQAIRRACDAGQLGQPGLIRLHDWRPVPTTDDRLSHVRFQEFLQQELDVACWLFDDTPVTVGAVRVKLTPPNVGVIAHLGFKDGGMAVIDCQYHLGSVVPYYSLSVIGANGAAYADDHHNTNLWFRDGLSGLPVAFAWDNLADQLQAFVDQLPLVDQATDCLHELRRARRVAEAVIAACESESAIQLNEAREQ